jgi:ribonuclease HI
MDLTLYFDGACEPRNPGGTGSWGWVATHPEGEVRTGSGAIPAAPTTTNNLAEWYALGHGLREIAERRAADPFQIDMLIIRGDSQLVIRQLTGEWACRAANLQPLLKRCLELLIAINAPYRAEWVPREQNAEADALSVKAWEEATGQPFPVRQRPGKERPPAESGEPDVDRLEYLMNAGLSQCCEAPLDTSRVIHRPGHRHHNHGPRYCSKCGKLAFMV